MAAVKKHECEYCEAPATKAGDRWKIQHERWCGDKPSVVEDVGPVTSVNDPDNAWFVTVEYPAKDGR